MLCTPLQFYDTRGMGGMPFGMLGQMGMPQVFEENYRCYSLAFAGRTELDKGGKSASLE